MRADTVDNLCVLFRKWVGEFEITDDPLSLIRAYGQSSGFAYLAKFGGSRDSFLDELREGTSLRKEHRSLFECVLSSWAGDTSCPSASANLLDFCATAVKTPEGWLKGFRDLYQSSPVAELVRDHATLASHYEACQDTWRQVRAPEYYRKAVRRALNLL